MGLYKFQTGSGRGATSPSQLDGDRGNKGESDLFFRGRWDMEKKPEAAVWGPGGSPRARAPGSGFGDGFLPIHPAIDPVSMGRTKDRTRRWRRGHFGGILGKGEGGRTGPPLCASYVKQRWKGSSSRRRKPAAYLVSKKPHPPGPGPQMGSIRRRHHRRREGADGRPPVPPAMAWSKPHDPGPPAAPRRGGHSRFMAQPGPKGLAEGGRGQEHQPIRRKRNFRRRGRCRKPHFSATGDFSGRRGPGITPATKGRF